MAKHNFLDPKDRRFVVYSVPRKIPPSAVSFMKVMLIGVIYDSSGVCYQWLNWRSKLIRRIASMNWLGSVEVYTGGPVLLAYFTEIWHRICSNNCVIEYHEKNVRNFYKNLFWFWLNNLKHNTSVSSIVWILYFVFVKKKIFFPKQIVSQEWFITFFGRFVVQSCAIIETIEKTKMYFEFFNPLKN